MDEKPESIWKKKWKGPRAFLFWLTSVSIAAFLVAVAITSVMFVSTPTPLFSWQGGFENFVKRVLKVMLVFIVAVATAFIFYRIVRWLFRWRNFKRFLFGLACFITVIALFYAEEDWRGKHDWEKFKRQWEAKGERFDWQSIVPPPVPDDENFAFSPVWIAEEKYTFQNTPERAKAWYGDRIYSEEVAKLFPLLPMTTTAVVGTNFWESNHLPTTPDKSGNWQTAQFLDMKPWQSFYRDLEKTNPVVEISITPQPQTPAQDVLLALSKFDPVIEQLRQDSARPDSRFPIQYDNGMPAAILLPHLAPEKQFALVLQLRAIAELQNGESEKAFDDVKLMLRLANASRTEPFLISHLVRIAILNLALQPVWEGLANHQWSDAQLVKLDSELAKLDFLADYESAVIGERALEIANIEFLRHPMQNPQFKRPRLYFVAPLIYLIQGLSGFSDRDEDSSPTAFQTLALSVGPSGWLDQNELCLAQFDTKWYLPVVDLKTKTILPARAQAADLALHQEIQHRTPLNLFETLFIPDWDNVAKKFAFAQSSANLARVAIALERYRLVHGKYPDSLAALAPQFMEKIPHDIIGGQPLHYRLTDDGQFVLYSVGWNETDDGGAVVLNQGKTSSGDISKGDWAWRYPQK